MSRAADALGVARLAAAALLPAALARPAPDASALGLFAVAAATDFLDGVVARRTGPTRHGAVLDVAADVAFVLAGTTAASALGLVSPVVPLAIAASATAYAAAARRGGTAARSGVGHVAGVLNYALVGLVAGARWVDSAAWPPLLAATGAGVVAVNVAAVLARALRGRWARPRPAPASRAEGRRGR
ncbi:MAG TPA: CDP-alcohol phosphatidyltransferase family protein [Candidatus Binatia bacterium]|nr:CDP-alcohol phosphatidyltransferase family protein [Candidatus Binatia bacterium]